MCDRGRYSHVMDPLNATEVVARNMRKLRRLHDWNAERLAEETAAIGVNWQRGVVTKLETGRRESVSVAELLALAAVFEVKPMALLQDNLTVILTTNP
jgi:transcriptional regulator with XRE-family HTH domain